ncbi:hypothetical protein L6452_18458 [Arctium lappa]|uniref:Uncharacterized protein n=1 Tax=Arctium lappa TaxID=4217 RepID=A0ACB9C6C6_ARCLA|nr:hypothetical protein L6452_18458 [Arctium lappa]
MIWRVCSRLTTSEVVYSSIQNSDVFSKFEFCTSSSSTLVVISFHIFRAFRGYSSKGGGTDPWDSIFSGSCNGSKAHDYILVVDFLEAD